MNNNNFRMLAHLQSPQNPHTPQSIRTRLAKALLRSRKHRKRYTRLQITRAITTERVELLNNLNTIRTAVCTALSNEYRRVFLEVCEKFLIGSDSLRTHSLAQHLKQELALLLNQNIIQLTINPSDKNILEHVARLGVNLSGIKISEDETYLPGILSLTLPNGIIEIDLTAIISQADLTLREPLTDLPSIHRFNSHAAV